ncbi:hypothetical protein C7212DRAFT_324621 [Tuber magnatum]|uniref:Uncharacterized protein n=1 Tax=Tuber magnatum TaxID=42249 RepID=A0A317SM53_9PEZI|nr:hypothetical protein C7212DRAFT_324621 [Tuber magnatum]
MANSKDQILKRLGISEGVYSQIREFLRKNVDWTAFSGGYEGFTALPEENLANLKHHLIKKFPTLDGKDEEIVWIIKRRYRNHQTIKKRKEKRDKKSRTCCHSPSPSRSPTSSNGDRKLDQENICSLRVDESRTIHHVDIDKRSVISIRFLLNPI